MWRAISITTGSIKAATATLFMMADITPPVNMMTTIILLSLLPASLNTKPPIALATPVRVKPPLRINTAQIVTTAGLLKPAKASPGVIRPVRVTAPSESRAVTSSSPSSKMRTARLPATSAGRTSKTTPAGQTRVPTGKKPRTLQRSRPTSAVTRAARWRA